MAEKKDRKSERKNFRFTPQVSDMIEDVADRIGMTENELVSTAVFDILSNNKNFIVCPSCKQYVAYKATLPTMDGVGELDCKCGTRIWYDFDTDKILKHK